MNSALPVYSVLQARSFNNLSELLSLNLGNLSGSGFSRSELASIVFTSLLKDRLGLPLRSSIFRFLHRPMSGAMVPRTITSTTNVIRSVKEPVL